MKESYGEDLASRSGLEPYADCGDAVGVASGKGTGRPAIELRNHDFRAPTLWCLREGHIIDGVTASRRWARRSRRTCACLKTPSARTGRSCLFPQPVTALCDDMDAVGAWNGRRTPQAERLT
jgi:hypothetical protein